MPVNVFSFCRSLHSDNLFTEEYLSKIKLEAAEDLNVKNYTFYDLMQTSSEEENYIDDTDYTEILRYSFDSFADNFLLADICSLKPNGGTYARVKGYIQPPEVFRQDNLGKIIIILYAQMHIIALKNPGEQISFNFYYDSDIEYDIFSVLNEGLIPSNVTLSFFSGDEGSIKNIAGNGLIDVSYRQTVDNWIFERGQIDLSIEGIKTKNKPSLWQDRITIEAFSSSIDQINLDTICNNKADVKGAFKAIERKEKELADNGYRTAAEEICELKSSLLIALATYAKYPSDGKDTFKASVKSAIDKAINSELKNHRGFLEKILYYTKLIAFAILTVATFGLAYAAAEGISYVVSGQSFFARMTRTSEVNAVLDLERTLCNLRTP